MQGKQNKKPKPAKSKKNHDALISAPKNVGYVLIGQWIALSLALTLCYLLMFAPKDIDPSTRETSKEFILFENQILSVLKHVQAVADHVASDAQIKLRVSEPLSTFFTLEDYQQLDPVLLQVVAGPKGSLRINNQLTPPLTAVTIDLIRRATRKKSDLPEMESNYLRAVAPVVHPTNSGLVTGAVVIAMDPQVLFKMLPNAKNLNLSAQLSYREQTIWSLSNSTPISGPARAEKNNIGGLWSLSITQPESAKPFPIEWIFAWIISTGVMILAGLLNWNHSRQYVKVVLKDLDSLKLSLMSTLQKSATKVRPNFNSLSFAEAHTELLLALEEIELASSNKVSSKSAPAPSKRINQISEEKAMNTVIEDYIATTSNKAPAHIPPVNQNIFRAYDIRGIVNQDLNEEVMYWIGRAIGSEAIELNQTSICVARDGRISGPILIAALKSGLQDSGLAVIDIGMVPTPVLYFATYHLKTQSGVMLTGSHNPPNYNGLKIVLGGNTLSGDSIQSLYQRIKQKNFVSGEGSEDIQDVSSAYTDRIASDVILSRPLHVVIDCGNGVTGCMVPHLFQQLGARVDSLFNEVDGMFPNHHPDPSKPENLKDLIQKVTEVGADFGIAFDGDGDRIGIVTNTGEIIYPDRLMMLISQDVLKKNPGASIIFDVKCTSDLANLISSWGGKPIMSRTGHSLIKAKLKETKAALAGEMSGHIFFNDRWYGFDDALYTAARVLEILSEINKTSGEVFESYPKKMTTPEINIAVTEASKFLIVDAMIEKAADFGGKKTTIDGLRIDYENGWGLLRASNTTPMLVARFEADDENTLEEIKDKFRTILLEIDSDLDLPF